MNDGFLKIIFDIVTSVRRTQAINLICVSFFIIIIPLHYSEFISSNLLLYPLSILLCAIALGSLTGLIINGVIDTALKLLFLLFFYIKGKINKRREKITQLTKNQELISKLDECYNHLSFHAHEVLIQLSNETTAPVCLPPERKLTTMSRREQEEYYKEREKPDAINSLINNGFVMIELNLHQNQYVIKLNPILINYMKEKKKNHVTEFLNNKAYCSLFTKLFAHKTSEVLRTTSINSLDNSFNTDILKLFCSIEASDRLIILKFKYDFKVIFESSLNFKLNSQAYINL